MTNIKASVLMNKSKTDTLTLTHLLNGYTKNQLVELSASLNAPLSKSWKKEVIISELRKLILNQPTSVYTSVLAETQKTFKDMKGQSYPVNQLEDIRAVFPLINRGVFYLREEKTQIVLIIPDEIYPLLIQAYEEIELHNTHLTIEENKFKRTPKEKLVLEWKEKMLAIYGTYSAEYIRSIWNRYFNDKMTIDESIDLLN